MATELYSLETVRALIKTVSGMLDVAFPGGDLRVIVKEGGWSNDEPWFLVIAATGNLRSQLLDIDSIEVRLPPQTIIDQIDHGGTVGRQAYAEGIFEQVLGRLVDKARDPALFASIANGHLKTYMARGGRAVGTSEQLPN